MSGRAPRFRLCLLLTREACRLDPLETMRRAVAGGADLVQVREKDAAPRELLAWTCEVVALGRELGVPVVVDDDVAVARAAGAAGVHLGQDDLPPEAARRVLGPEALIGWSTHDLDQVEAAARSGAVDYVGFGPAFPTATKGYAAGLGPAAVAEAVAASPLPVLAIGGITPENRWRLPREAGVAVCAALCGAERPAEVAYDLVEPPV